MIGKGTEVLGENLPQCRFIHQKSHMLHFTMTPQKLQCLQKPSQVNGDNTKNLILGS
jgi:hypothetical protein